MQRGPSGHYQPISTVGETARAFVPAPLPPISALEIDGKLGALFDAASTALVHEKTDCIREGSLA